MEFIKTNIHEVVIIEPKVFGDNRGYFFESYKQKALEHHIGYSIDFIQDNESSSSYGVLRGLHFQAPPYVQTKLVRVIKGAVLDVAVDIRKGSPTYGKYVAVELNEDNKRQLLVPRGFAHGFVVLSDEAIFCYKVDNYYKKEYEGGIIYDDSELAIDWQIAKEEVKLSEKDLVLSSLKDFDSPFSIEQKYYK